MKKFLLIPIVKGIVSIGFPIAITVLVSLITWNNLIWDGSTIGKFIAFIIISLIYLGVSIFYIVLDNKEKKEGYAVERLQKMISWVSERLSEGAGNLGNLTKLLNESGKVNLDLWGYDIECNHFCQFLCETLVKEDEEISVYCTRREKTKTQQTYYMFAGYSTSEDLPQRYRQSVNYKVAQNYYYVKSFDKNDTIIMLDTDNIQRNFTFKEEQQLCKYRQYISIPIYDSGGEVISRIEIVTYNNTIIGRNKTEVKKILKKYVTPALNWINFSYQTQEALITETPGATIERENYEEKT